MDDAERLLRIVRNPVIQPVKKVAGLLWMATHGDATHVVSDEYGDIHNPPW